RTLETSDGRSRLVASDGKYGGLTGRALTGQAKRKEHPPGRALAGGRDVEFWPAGQGR
ncbi:hypothetical protein M9458_008174, partial [Cirrhinus mrigala]